MQPEAARTPHVSPQPPASVVDLKPAAGVGARKPITAVRAWIASARVRQWPKNLLVLAAPAAAGALGRPHVLVAVSLTFGVFCLLASGVYLLNDVHDAPDDRRHPLAVRAETVRAAIGRGRRAAAGGTGAGGAPEEVLMGDGFIRLAGAAWLGMFLLGI